MTQQQSKNYHVKSILLFFVMMVLMTVVFTLGMIMGARDASIANRIIPLEHATLIHQDKNTDVDFGLFWRAWDLLQQHYVDRGTLDARSLVRGAITGMFRATEDPYTVFLDRKHNQELAEELEGSFDGIGAEIGLRDKLLTVIAPLDGSPAQRAGLLPGDKIIAIDGAPTFDVSIDDAIDLIRGPKGTPVLLTVLHPSASDPEDVRVLRDHIKVESVRTEPLIDDGIAYIRIAQFGEHTTRDFSKIIRELIKKNPQGLIIDLRNNPGGYMSSAVDIVGHFVPKGTPVLITEDAQGQQEIQRTLSTPLMSDVPLVILINEGSASASEIFAAALRTHYHPITLVGKQTFGKGSVQELFPLTKDTAAKITVAKWLTPKKEQINGVGIAPDEEVPYTREDFDAERDPQRDRAVEILREQIHS